MVGERRLGHRRRSVVGGEDRIRIRRPMSRWRRRCGRRRRSRYVLGLVGAIAARRAVPFGADLTIRCIANGHSPVAPHSSPADAGRLRPASLARAVGRLRSGLGLWARIDQEIVRMVDHHRPAMIREVDSGRTRVALASPVSQGWAGRFRTAGDLSRAGRRAGGPHPVCFVSANLEQESQVWSRR